MAEPFGTVDLREFTRRASSPMIMPVVETGAQSEPTMSEFRVEKDSMGEVKVPATAYYGAQTQRAIENFPISGQPLPSRLIHALGLVKIAAAVANKELNLLKPELADG